MAKHPIVREFALFVKLIIIMVLITMIYVRNSLDSGEERRVKCIFGLIQSPESYPEWQREQARRRHDNRLRREERNGGRCQFLPRSGVD